VLDTSAERRRTQTVKSLYNALRKVHGIFRNVEAELRGALTLGQTGFGVSGEKGRNTLFWTRPGSTQAVHSTNYEVLAAGDELVIRTSGETLFRTSLSNPDYEDAFREAVRSWLLAQISSVVSDPHTLPPEANNFMEVRPFSSLQKAAKEAARTGRQIMAFVYDPTQPERGKLQYALQYFLQNRRTRDTMNAAFVTALVPLSQLATISKVLDDQSMEQSRWVILDSALHSLEQSVIYANPQEGERIMADLSKRHGNV
jgi:serine/threonine-protein kinase